MPGDGETQRSWSSEFNKGLRGKIGVCRRLLILPRSPFQFLGAGFVALRTCIRGLVHTSYGDSLVVLGAGLPRNWEYWLIDKKGTAV